MTSQEAIRVLMLSPIYFRLTPADRRQLIREYCNLFTQVCKRRQRAKKEE
ncbi:hypothetical protein UWK_00820 [Desulfocapsa sulfexigens DSM 10523]|uniref:Uncharacterized protein n=1 Tax=Desulfocapsa sulfexigens (strain DSM 10523 / SB164P1) TaxID=1167006 RepID=M1NC87_DESSD|nr:hypothetical protein [Desulfocapsa sulfexigens]AGF77394.1 hypothetical protein UWK_00820 [Desulfocapsa sulfexigens DSM 10523]